jgi:hypothetical protein
MSFGKYKPSRVTRRVSLSLLIISTFSVTVSRIVLAR